ncbi:helix-turn-helix domain-containing protein [Aquimarina sp. D1M17]|uniref:helix-turn-helix domain-containing protein n=1 Tax=Aquimarina acroporae TaxID=2937283 RepID=UPI0020C07A56|nr:helix-turn-helix domain-containing protein [Aquimarina acroporae]MCK8520133.1 helix-turn-helix domain-containing protein [Aquimarina acroporae]
MKNIINIETISQVHDFLQFPKPKHPLVSVLPITDKMTNYDYGDHSYVFSFYQISLKLGISGSLNYGRNSYDFQEGTMVFMKPNQTIKIENRPEYKGSSGWTLLFHPDLIHKSELGKIIKDYSFFNYETNEALHLSDEEKSSLTDLVKKIEKEYNQNIDKHSQELIITNIDLLLKYCKRYYDRQFFTRTNLNKDLVTKFQEIMSEYFDSEKYKDLGVLTVSYCANKLNMSANYLGDLLKNETGISAKEHINSFLIDQAKTKMLTTSKSISEIAYDFGFEYPQSFNKLFKSKTGLTPTQYRSSN